MPICISAERIIEDLDRWLADHDRDRNPNILGSGKARVGFMTFQIREILEDLDDEGGRD